MSYNFIWSLYLRFIGIALSLFITYSDMMQETHVGEKNSNDSMIIFRNVIVSCPGNQDNLWSLSGFTALPSPNTIRSFHHISFKSSYSLIKLEDPYYFFLFHIPHISFQATQKLSFFENSSMRKDFRIGFLLLHSTTFISFSFLHLSGHSNV